MLRGREAVRADRRLGTDEKHIRAQSTILDKSHPKPLLLLFITVFFVRIRFSSARKTRLARASAQWPLLICECTYDAVCNVNEIYLF
jgi:hypothetical protein